MSSADHTWSALRTGTSATTTTTAASSVDPSAPSRTSTPRPSADREGTTPSPTPPPGPRGRRLEGARGSKILAEPISVATRYEGAVNSLGAGGPPMPKGGARSRSGPPKDPKSRTSERAGFVLTALPFEGYAGRPPGLNQFLPSPVARHRQVWAELWSTPQACAWSMERWRWPVAADLVRCMVAAEQPGAPVAIVTAVRQLRDDLGLSTAGLLHNGWAIAPPMTEPAPGDAPSAGPDDEVGQRRQRRLQKPA